jgi:hypothetical protein
MASKTNGATFKSFMQDNKYWFQRYWDDDEVTVDGVVVDEFDEMYENVSDSSVVVIKAGYVYSDEDESFKGMELTSFFNRWLKMQSTISVTVTIDRSREAEFKALMKANGFKI